MVGAAAWWVLGGGCWVVGADGVAQSWVLEAGWWWLVLGGWWWRAVGAAWLVLSGGCWVVGSDGAW